jgi:hypothetical protein
MSSKGKDNDKGKVRVGKCKDKFKDKFACKRKCKIKVEIKIKFLC